MKTTRETVAEVMDKMGGETEEPAEAVGTQAAEASGGAHVEGAAEVHVDAGEQQKAADRARDEKGKFAKADEKTRAEPAGAAGSPKPGAEGSTPSQPATSAAPVPPKLKAPADWRPAAQAEFDRLPRIVQEEAIRLHVEAKKILQDGAGHRQGAETWTRTVQPYEHMFKASGKTAHEGVGWLLQQYAALQSGGVSARKMVAGLIRDYVGIDEPALKALASELEGQPAQARPAESQPVGPQQLEEMLDKRLDAREATTRQNAEIKAIQDFEASEPQFLPNLTQEIATIVGLEKRQGKPITVDLLKSAYERALRINPETAAILKQRDDAAAAEKAKADAAKRAAAGAGLKTEPGGPNGAPKARTTREEVEFQMNKRAGQNRA